MKRGSPARDLTLITGPLGVTFGAPGRWKPQLENGDLAHYRPPAPHRVGAWLSLAPRIDDHVFIKLFAHGAQEKNAACLLGGGLDLMFRELARAVRRPLDRAALRDRLGDVERGRVAAAWASPFGASLTSRCRVCSSFPTHSRPWAEPASSG